MNLSFRRPDPASDAASGPADLAGEMSAVRRLETSIAQRLQAARDSRDIVDHAGLEADEILARARAQATDAAERIHFKITAEAEAHAERVGTAAEAHCDAIVATSKSRRTSDVTVVVDGALPALPSSTTKVPRQGTAP